MNNNGIEIKGHKFKTYLAKDEIAELVKQMALRISTDMQHKSPLFIPTLTGSFIFAADLVRAMLYDVELAFIKYSSYSGMTSNGHVDTELAFPLKCAGRNVVIVEDIVDTGNTMNFLLSELSKLNPASVSIATLLFKPDSFHYNFKIDYIGRSIQNDFIVGYGMDYDGTGRCYGDIYVIDE